jgi:hypothetical protein
MTNIIAAIIMTVAFALVNLVWHFRVERRRGND